jgi:N-acetylmuramoyl-L-alanine amidase
MSFDGLPLSCGGRGEAVRDLQRRLIAAGYGIEDEPGTFGTGTERVIRAFQQIRGLAVDGCCGPETWAALIEAGYQLGDRLLYLRRPMLRGDDVAELQRKLGALGFDAGRVDGIFGPDSERAIRDFERNTGLTVDGVCGPEVLAGLSRLGTMTAGPAGVAGIRERDRLARSPEGMVGRCVVVGNLGGLAAPAVAVTRALQATGAAATLVDHPDRSVQASQANTLDADAYLGLGVSTDAQARTAYYATTGFESAGGRHLAELVAEEIAVVLEEDSVSVAGMRLPILRETRMPAVVCHLAIEPLVEHHQDLAQALARATGRWIEAPLPS